MPRDKTIKSLQDYIPLIILVIVAGVMAWSLISDHISISWQNITGLAGILLIALAFRRNHKWGVLVTGIVLLAGLLGALGFQAGIVRGGFTLGPTGHHLEFYFGDPIFLIYLAIHFLVSHRHYQGFFTKQYWQQVKEG